MRDLFEAGWRKIQQPEAPAAFPAIVGGGAFKLQKRFSGLPVPCPGAYFPLSHFFKQETSPVTLRAHLVFSTRLPNP
ncbi:MAG: hypothetical protein ACO3JG_16350 [Luteolibacter sp.]